MTKWLVYFHRNPTTAVVFYVGIASGAKRPYDYSGRNNFWRHYVSKHGLPVVEIVRRGLSEKRAKAIEVKFIAHYGFRRHGGTLVNVTAGGDDQPMRHQHVRDKVARAMKGRTFSEETRRKMSESAKRRGMTKCIAAAMRRMAAGWNPMNLASARAAVSRAMKGRVFTQQHRDRNGRSHSKPVTQRTLNGEIVAVYPSQRAAGIAMGCTGENIGMAMKGKTAKGFRWARATPQECAEYLPSAQPSKIRVSLAM